MVLEQNKKNAAFDVLRAIAVSLVVLGHFIAITKELPLVVRKIAFSFASYGIPLFFIISGFLLSASLMSLLKRHPHRIVRPVAMFFIKRGLRIYPAYIVSLLLLATYYEVQAEDFWVHFFNIHNFFSAYHRSINGVYWTLAVEFQWYLLAPWLILFFMHSQTRFVWSALALCFLSSLLIRGAVIYQYLLQAIDLHELVWLAQDQLYIHLFNFLIGVTLYKFSDTPVKMQRFWVNILLLVLFILGYIISGISDNIVNYQGVEVFYKTLLNYIAIILLALLVAHFLQLKVHFRYERIILFISAISYSLYIYHFPLLHYLVNFNFSWQLFLLIYLCSSVFIATISYYVIEKPFLRYSALLGKVN
jgi:peptidoglycan/LPS O-acetylase OafA/YrhL